MGFILWVLGLLCSIGSLVCWIMVLVAIFKANQIWQGVVGIICPLFAFIWGWMQATPLGIRKVMQIWTVLIIAGIVLNLAAGAMIGTTASRDFGNVPTVAP